MPKEIKLELDFKYQLKTGIREIVLSIPENKITPYYLRVNYCSDYGHDFIPYANLYHEKVADFYRKMKPNLPPNIVKQLGSTYAKIIEFYEKDTTPPISAEQIKKLDIFYHGAMEKAYLDAKQEDKMVVYLVGELHSSAAEQLFAQIIFANFRELGGKAYALEAPNYDFRNRGFYTSSGMHTTAALCSGYEDMMLWPLDAVESKEMGKLVEEYDDIGFSSISKEQYEESKKKFTSLMEIRDKHMGERILKLALNQQKNGNRLILAGCGSAHLPGIINYLKSQKDIAVDVIAFMAYGSVSHPYFAEFKDFKSLLTQITIENYSIKMPEIIPIPALDKCKIPGFYNNLQLYQEVLRVTGKPSQLPSSYFSPSLVMALIDDYKKNKGMEAEWLSKDRVKLLKQMLAVEVDQKASVSMQYLQTTEFFQRVCIAINRAGLPEYPLLWAVRGARRELLQELLKTKAFDVNLPEEKTGATALSEARKLGYKKMAEDLIQAGAKSSLEDEKPAGKEKLSAVAVGLFSSPAIKESSQPVNSCCAIL